MIENSFTEADKLKLVEFMNFMAVRASFSTWKTEDTIIHFKLLSHIQNVLLPKIDAHIFEVTKVVQAPEVPKESKSKGK